MVDQRNAFKIMVARMSYDELSVQLMPNLYNLKDLSDQDCEYNEDGYFNYPPLLNLNFESIAEDDACLLLDDGFKLFLYLGSKVSSKTLQSLFGKKSLTEISNPLESEEVEKAHEEPSICRRRQFLFENPEPCH